MKNFLYILSIILAFSACKTTRPVNRDYLYFQNNEQAAGNFQYKESRIKPHDILGIQVFSASLNQEQALLFNMANGAVNTGAQGTTGATASGATYRVDNLGNILLPLVGKVRLENLTLAAATDTLTNKLSFFIKNPQVIARQVDFKVQVLGEVKRAGPVSMNSETANLIDAIALAGDLNDEGRRDSIIVIRRQNNERKMYYADLRSPDIFNSPVFQLQQNDVVYVQPTLTKLKLLSVDLDKQQKEQRTLQYIGFGLGAFSVILNLILIISR